MIKLHKYFNEDKSMWEVMNQFFRNVCPIAFFDHEIDYFIGLESAASKYNALPYEGGYLDQPNKLIEAFDVIRATRATYEHKRYQEQKKKQKEYEKNSSR